MAKHRRQDTSVSRRIAGATALAATATVAVPAVANAAEVSIPNTGFSVEVQGLEDIPNIEKVPNIDRYVPELAQRVTGQANYSAPVSAPQGAPAAPQATPAPAQTTGQKVVEAVRSKVGSPYAYGAAGPSSFDCSGLTSWAYAQAGKSIPRTSQAQASAGQQVPLSEIQPGDIVAYYGGASHVAIYVGNGMMIDALNSGTPVAERPLHYMPIHSVVRF